MSIFFFSSPPSNHSSSQHPIIIYRRIRNRTKLLLFPEHHLILSQAGIYDTRDFDTHLLSSLFTSVKPQHEILVCMTFTSLFSHLLRTLTLLLTGVAHHDAHRDAEAHQARAWRPGRCRYLARNGAGWHHRARYAEHKHFGS